MARWEPGAAGRLHDAAMSLYVERGFEATTVAEIADRAGVTARTFFRYYSDKREVLFGGSQLLQDAMEQAVAAAPADAAPMTVVAGAMDAASALIGDDVEHSRRRWSVISVNAELRERELIKMERLAGALADGLRARGVTDPRASLAAEAGVAVFRVGYERWVSGAAGEKVGLVDVVRSGFEELGKLTSRLS